jgi:hypothetical protein
MIDLLYLILMLALVGFIVYLIITYIPMPAPFPQVIIVIVVVALLLWLLAGIPAPRAPWFGRGP